MAVTPKASRHALEAGRLHDGEALYWLLEFRYAGQTHRYSTAAVAPLDAAGTAYPHAAGLAGIDVELSADLLGDTASERSASVEIIDGRDWALDVARGWPVTGAECELSLWILGRTIEERVVMITGRPENPIYGETGRPLSFTLAQRAWRDGAKWPPDDAVINATTWPSHDPDRTGQVYPFVWGRPGVYPDTSGTSSTVPGSPAYMIDTTTGNVLIAGHPVSASSVTISDPGGAATSVETVYHVADGLGRIVAEVRPGLGTYAAGDDLFVIWDQGGGGMVDPDGGDELDGAGQLLRYWLDRSSQGVDRGRVASVSYILDRLAEFDGYVDEQVTPWEWVRAHVVPLLPVSIDAGPDGLFPRVWLPDQDKGALSLEDGRNCERIGPVETSTDDVITRARLSWALDDDTGEYQRITLLTGDPDGDDPEQIGDAYATLAAHRGTADADEANVEADHVYDAATALAVLRTLIRARGLPTSSFAVRGGPVLGTLEPLQPVDYTDAGLHLTDQRCWIRSIRWEGTTAVTLELVIVDDPIRDARSL